MSLSESEARQIVSALRSGTVPRQGLHHFATGLDALLETFEEELAETAEGSGHGRSKWVRGEYGSGKTFATRLMCARARHKGFATSEVQISINDTPLCKLEAVYRRLMERLTTDAHGDAAFKAVVDAWLFEIGEEVTRLEGLAETDPTFPDAVERRLEDKLHQLDKEASAFALCLRAYHRAMLAGDFATAQGLLAWLGGQPHIDREILSRAHVKGTVDGQAALSFLRGVLVLLRQSDYRGLVLVLDEVETVQRMQTQTLRDKSLNVLRQLMDMLQADQLPGLYLLVTGTPELFDGYKGLRSTQALYDRVRVRWGADPKFDNLRAVQVRLPPFDPERLLQVGVRVRDIFPAKHADRVRGKVDDRFLGSLVDRVTTGFGGKVAIAPRYFLRELVDVMDRVDLREDFDPLAHYELKIDEADLTPEEVAAVRGESPAADASGAAPPKRRRLDG
ncbi:MAG: BREX system ATP-binding protein BrxD [Deltaproteobacteria bacterium]|nr:BREX system ATP-binding protein BrxD [Deltaproteobacteria bacterium]